MDRNYKFKFVFIFDNYIKERHSRMLLAGLNRQERFEHAKHGPQGEGQEPVVIHVENSYKYKWFHLAFEKVAGLYIFDFPHVDSR